MNTYHINICQLYYRNAKLLVLFRSESLVHLWRRCVCLGVPPPLQAAATSAGPGRPEVLYANCSSSLAPAAVLSGEKKVKLLFRTSQLPVDLRSLFLAWTAHCQ